MVTAIKETFLMNLKISTGTGIYKKCNRFEKERNKTSKTEKHNNPN